MLNKLPDNENLLTWEANRPLLGLLMIVLSIIHLNNNVVEQGIIIYRIHDIKRLIEMYHRNIIQFINSFRT